MRFGWNRLDYLQEAASDRHGGTRGDLLRDDRTDQDAEMVGIVLQSARTNRTDQVFEDGIAAREVPSGFQKDLRIHGPAVSKTKPAEPLELARVTRLLVCR